MHYDDDTPDDPVTEHLEEGWAKVAEGDLEGALRAARACLDLAEIPDGHNLFGFVRAAQGDVDGALRHYRRAITLDEFYTDALLNAAELLLHPVGDVSEALRLIDLAIEHAEDKDTRADAILLKVDALLQSSDHEAAAKALRSLPRGPFEKTETTFLIGRAYFEVGDMTRAGEWLQVAAREDQTNPEIYYYLGMWMEAQGDRPGATVSFLQCRDLDGAAPAPPWSTVRPAFERRVRAALKRIDKAAADALDGALVVVTHLPGREVIAEGVDPRLCALADEVVDGKILRLFVYQRNCERLASTAEGVEDVCTEAIEREVAMALGAQPRSDESPPSAK